MFGILFNVQADAAFDPLTATYDVRTGVTMETVERASHPEAARQSCRQPAATFSGFNEYTVQVSWSAPLTLTAGAYCFHVTPQCLNTLDRSCSVFRQSVSNSNLALTQFAVPCSLFTKCS